MLGDLTLRTHDMPLAMRLLLNDYPRDGWKAHPGFSEKTRAWLEAHQMFRRLGRLVRTQTELYIDKSREPVDAGLDILEKDHEMLDGVLDRSARSGRRIRQ